MTELKKDYPKLRSCPFCGGEAALFGEFNFWIGCNKCGCKMMSVCHNKEEAIEAWNRRVEVDE